jgi:predicted  nucleic acid-binding Zn-ribbon protein
LKETFVSASDIYIKSKSIKTNNNQIKHLNQSNMKTITKFLRPLFATLTVAFFSSVASAQTLEEVALMKVELEANIASGTAKLNDVNLTSTLSAQELANLQAEVNTAQSRLAALAPIHTDLSAREERSRQEQTAADLLASQMAAKAVIDAQYQAEQAQNAAAQAARVAEQQAIAQKLAVISNPGRYAPAPDPNHPSWMPFTISTGNAEQDAQMVRDWLLQHGIVR